MRYPRPFHRSAAGKLPLGHTTVAQSKGAGKPPRKGPKLVSWPTREREAYGFPRTQNRSPFGASELARKTGERQRLQRRPLGIQSMLPSIRKRNPTGDVI